MNRMSLAAQRRLFGVGLAGAAACGLLWLLSPGLPILWGPTASAAEKAAGQDLFEHEWAANDPLASGDGLGPVFNAKSCVACHFQGGVGGGGELPHNAVGFEVLARPADPTFRSGTVHNFSTTPEAKESQDKLRKLFPVVSFPVVRSNGGMPGCPTVPVRRPDFDPLRTESVNTTALFGAGWLDCVSDKAITTNCLKRGVAGAVKEFHLDFSDTIAGRPRFLAGGRVGKFGWKAQFATLEEFVAAACANELGLGTPYSAQAVPLGTSAGGETPRDLTRRQFRSLVAFVATLPKPVETPPADPTARDAAESGKELFGSIGCASCHLPEIGGLSGAYTDFLLHVVDDPGKDGTFGDGYGSPPLPDLPRPDDLPKPEEWKTPALWGVADSAPYFHDGGSPTLEDAIVRHRGEAKGVTAAYQKLPTADKVAVVAFLKTLKAPPDAMPVRDMKVTRLAAR